MQQIEFEPGFASWQSAARRALARSLTPGDVTWIERGVAEAELNLAHQVATPDLELEASHAKTPFRVPKKFLSLARMVARHANAARWPLLYRTLWRLTHGEPDLLENPADADSVALAGLEREVQRDGYRMRQYIRFRETALDGHPWFVAWYEPDHDSVDLNADYFSERYANMRWSILTPQRSMHWDGHTITLSAGVDKSSAPLRDDVERLWVTYYSSIFNPARVKVRAMKTQMPVRTWKNLPEAHVIAPLLAEAPRRVEAMLAASHAKVVQPSDYALVTPPKTDDWPLLRDAAKSCRACPLWKNATCTVFGSGPANAPIVLVGEQPGDAEDKIGEPFVGPAGQLLDRALAQAGLDRERFYVTNAVKHFKWEPRGKRRIHKTPSGRDIASCRPWLEAELNLIRPSLLVALGATAARSIMNETVLVTEQRGHLLNSQWGPCLVTLHPSALLRLADGVDHEAEFAHYVRDLERIKPYLS